MKKKIIIGVVIVVVAVAAYYAYAINRSSTLSPHDMASYSYQGLDIKVDYSRPSKRGRLIFGEEKDKALQPNGKYWRLGANAVTQVTFSKNVTLAGKPVDAGTYRIYCVPEATLWHLFLNSDLGGLLGGASEPDHALDILQIDIPLQTNPTEVEKFTIEFSSDSTGASMNFMWDRALVKVPITIQ